MTLTPKEQKAESFHDAVRSLAQAYGIDVFVGAIIVDTENNEVSCRTIAFGDSDSKETLYVAGELIEALKATLNKTMNMFPERTQNSPSSEAHH